MVCGLRPSPPTSSTSLTPIRFLESVLVFQNQETALHKAAELNNVAMVRMLLDAGASPSKRTLPEANHPKGVTPLSITTSKEIKSVLRKAIKARKRAAKAAEAAAGAEGSEAEAAEPKDDL